MENRQERKMRIKIGKSFGMGVKAICGGLFSSLFFFFSSLPKE
jgi:hypothetical protein